MRIALGVSRTAVLLLAGVAAGCVTASPGGGSAQDDLPGLSLLPPVERQQVIDSLQAEQIAATDGPRVRVTANFDNEAGSRRVEAFVHADDDAYILVGHIDASGRLRIVYPDRPGSDGFVRGGHVYRVAPFFGGFADEFRYRRATDYTRLSMVRSRRDSYDAGTGYVFVIASWRPMRLARVTDGNRWSSYELSNEEYLDDPREAVEELAQVVAGDSREAYTVEYAHYTSTNYGMYRANYVDRCSFAGFGSYGFGIAGLAYSPYGNGMGYGYSPFGLSDGYFGFGVPVLGFFSPFVSYAREYDGLTGCSYYVPVYRRPLYATTWPLPPATPQPNGRGPIKPESPRPPKLGGGPTLTGPGTSPNPGRARAIMSGLHATDLNGLHPANGAEPTLDPRSGLEQRPSIEQMIRRHQAGERAARPGAPRLTPPPQWQQERPRFSPPRPTERRYEPPPQAQPRWEHPSEARPHVETARPSPPPRFEPPPMRMEPMHAPPPPRSSGSSGSSSSSSGKPKQ